MQHNSIAARELLRHLNNHPLIRERRDPHRNLELTAPSADSDDMIPLLGEWFLDYDVNLVPIELVASDLRDFLTRVGVGLTEKSSQVIRIEMGLQDKGFCITAELGEIWVQGHDVSALWAAITYIEQQMREAGEPVLRRGIVRRQPAWDVQISAPAWGANLFVPDLGEEFLSDDAFRLMAHHGINGMLIYGDWILYATHTELPELNHPRAEHYLQILAETVRRALNYGIRLYYCAVGPLLPESHPLFARLPGSRGALYPWRTDAGESQFCLCSSNPEALQFHADTFRNLFKNIPELGGLIAIIGGEVFYHCYTRPADSRLGETNCPHCRDTPAEDVVATLMEVVSNAVHAVAPDAAVMAWAYSAHKVWSADYNQLELIDRLPNDVIFMSEIDQGQFQQKEDYVKEIWDYSVDLDRPSDRVIAQSLRCAGRGLKMTIKTEAAHGIELLQFPYVPCLPRLGRKWQGVRALRPWGTLIRWGFIGVFGSVADQLAYAARWNPNFSPELDCGAIARSLYGNADLPVLRAWRSFDRAVGHIPTLTLGDYYTGPMWLGPAHPLPTWTGTTPEIFTPCCRLDLQGSDPGSDQLRLVHDNLVLTSTAQMRVNPAPDMHPEDSRAYTSPPCDLTLWEREFEIARNLAFDGWQELNLIDSVGLSNAARAEVDEQLILGEYLYRTFVTTCNTLRFIVLKEQGAPLPKLQTIARDEYINTAAAQSLYERAPWLNLNLRLDGAFPDILKIVDAKTRLLTEFLGSG